MRKTVVIVAWFVMAVAAPGASDSFELVKRQLSADGCSFFEFLSIVESDVFDTVDTAFGSARLSHDGRYNIKIADEQYVYDGSLIYSYSAGSNQVVIESPDAGRVVGEEFSFITRLDSLYETTTLQPDFRYRLVKRADIGGDYPDSMEVTVDNKNLLLKQLSYLDVNDDLNIIVFKKQKYGGRCEDSLFLPNFPDSVETVKL